MKLCYGCMTYREIDEFKFTEDDPLRQVCNECKANANDEKDKENGEQE
jgi:predicted Fe-S protein YdhL (DUF1289 family)